MSGKITENEVNNILSSHIPKERVILPNDYYDNVPEITLGKTYVDKGITNGRDISRSDYFRLGDTILSIPPESINIEVRSKNQNIPRLRQKDGTNIKSGYSIREIVIPIKFNGLYQINGLKIDSPDGDYYIDGLRSLISQIKRTPFLPVENYVVNVINDIHSVIVKSINISTVDGFPGLLQGQLVLCEFNSQPYTGMPDELFNDVINWDIFRWYYQRGLKNLVAIPNLKVSHDFVFGIIDESLLQGTIDESKNSIPDNTIDVGLDNDIYMTSINIGMGGIFKDIQLSDFKGPVTQYFGNNSCYILCTFETQNEDNIIALNSMYQTLERLAKEYRNRTAQGFVRFENPVARLFGINYVMIDSMKIDTVEDMPGLYQVQMIMTSFDRTQNQSEKALKVSPFPDGGSIDDLINNDARTKYRETRYDQIVEDKLNSMDLYPDLELPTYEEYVDAINNINEYRIANNLEQMNMVRLFEKDDRDNNTQIKWKSYTDMHVESRNTFKDVNTEYWAKNHIYDLVSRGIIKGYTDGTFMPNKNISRGEVAVILVNATNSFKDFNTTAKTFSDVDVNKWYYKYIECARYNGIISGYADGSFKPDMGMTREDVITAICNAKGINLIDVDLQKLIYNDADNISEYAVKPIIYATRMGWIVGYPDGSIRPKNKISRAECCAIISNAFKTALNALEGKYELFDRNNWCRRVDPDFYFHYPTLEQAGLSDIIEDTEIVKQAKENLQQYLDDATNGITTILKKNTIKQSASDYETTVKGKISLEQMLEKQYSSNRGIKPQKWIRDGVWVDATKEETLNYLDPDRHKTGSHKYQFLDLSKSIGVTVADLNEVLDGKGVLDGQGAAFLTGAQKYGVSEPYLISHALLETGNGTSDLITGVMINGKKVYNAYGIGAFDKSATASGSKKASEEGWTSIEKAIIGGAKFIGEKYIRGEMNQNTLYKMRWNPEYPDSTHQYATAIEWAIEQVDRIKTMYDKFPSAELSFEFPEYSNYDKKDDTAQNKITFPSPLVNYRCDNTQSSKPPYISSKFGLRVNPYTKKEGQHNGIDIAVNEGEPIIAVQDGFILKAGWQDDKDRSEGYGQRIIIQHDDGQTITLYAHLSKIVTGIQGMKVKQGEIIGYTGNTGGSTGPHLHYEVKKNGTPVDPISYLTGENGYIIGKAKELTTIEEIGVNSGGQIVNPPIDFTNLGRPLKQDSGTAFSNSKEGLIERMFVDQMEYNRRGTMCRAFPSYCILFVDEGTWMDGRKLWSNYYLYNSIIDISIEKDRGKSADTALINLTNIYNTLDTDPKIVKTEFNWHTEFLKSIQWYNDKILNEIIQNKNQLLDHFKLRPGARMHIRLGYGNSASKLPIVFNGMITECNTSDMVTIIAQSDGLELTNIPIGTNEEDESTSIWNVGTEPGNIITHILTERDSEFLSRISGGRWNESSKYGIEHFGNFYFRSLEGKVTDNYKEAYQEMIDMFKYDGKRKDAMKDFGNDIYWSTLGKSVMTLGGDAIAHIAKIVTPEGSDFDNIASKRFYEDYDLLKNIYVANPEVGRTNSGQEYESSFFFDYEDSVSMYTFNRTAWDIFKELAMTTGEFIAYPHIHQLRSTLFFGIPTWNVKYKYEYVNEDKVYEYAKPYSQVHIISSMFDIIDNDINATMPEFTMARTIFAGPDGEKETTDTVYADRSIKSELQRLKMVESGIKWSVTGFNSFDSVTLDNFAGKFVIKLIDGKEPGARINRRYAIAKVQDSFKKIYQGKLTILGDASIKPYDIVCMEDDYIGMSGNIEVRKVIHHFGLDTGFVTEIEPDMCVLQNDIGSDKKFLYKALFTVGTTLFLKYRTAKMASTIMKKAKQAYGIAQKGTGIIKTATGSAASWRSVKAISALGKDIKIGSKAFIDAVKSNKTISDNVKLTRLVGNKFRLKSSSTILRSLSAGSKLAKSYQALINSKGGKSALTIGKSILEMGKTIKNIKNGLMVGLANPATWALVVEIAIAFIITEVIYLMFESLIEYFEDRNVIHAYPLFYKNRPYIAGVDGHELLIPGYTDAMLKNNMTTSELKQLNEQNKVLSNIPDEDELTEILDDLKNGKIVDKTMADAIKHKWVKNYKHLPWTKDGRPDYEFMRKYYNDDIYNGNGIKYIPDLNVSIVAKMNKQETYRPVPMKYVMYGDPENPSVTLFNSENVLGIVTASKSSPVFAFCSGKVVSVFVDEWYQGNDQVKSFWEKFTSNVVGTIDNITNSAGKVIDKNAYHSLMIIEHDNISYDNRNKFYTLYFNLKTFNFTEGDIIKGGECIGSTFDNDLVNKIKPGSEGILFVETAEINPIFNTSSNFAFSIIGGGGTKKAYNPEIWISNNVNGVIEDLDIEGILDDDLKLKLLKGELSKDEVEDIQEDYRNTNKGEIEKIKKEIKAFDKYEDSFNTVSYDQFKIIEGKQRSLIQKIVKLQYSNSFGEGISRDERVKLELQIITILNRAKIKAGIPVT